jgi:hypothetical protein
MLSDLLSIFMSGVSAARLLREVRWSNGVRCVYLVLYMLYVGVGIGVCIGGIGVRPV